MLRDKKWNNVGLVDVKMFTSSVGLLQEVYYARHRQSNHVALMQALLYLGSGVFGGGGDGATAAPLL